MTRLLEEPLPFAVSERQACDALAICRNSLRAARARHGFCGPVSPERRKRRQAHQPRGLSAEERAEVKAVLTSPDYQDQPPAQVYYSLLQQGVYLCSISTMHRLIRADGLSGERRQQRPACPQPIPRLQAVAPNQVWTWDIAKLPTRKRGEYLSLYVVMDLFSRYIVAWMLSRKENRALSSQLITEAHERYAIQPDQLTLHQDRGAPMTAHCYLDLLGELAITASHSRPRVSNDKAPTHIKQANQSVHVVPLSRQAVSILEELQPYTGRFHFVFPSARGASKPLSDNGLRVALRTMGYDNDTMTPHGFRGMASSMLNELGRFNPSPYTQVISAM